MPPSATRPCALCAADARYTCPRCSTPTCSLACSRAHKARTACSGERNSAAYVHMNAYGWGAMMRDYAFLEDVARKARACGDHIVRRRLAPTPKHCPPSKRDLLKAHLDAWDIDMDVLPVGMHRRLLNQSTLDLTTQSVLLTVEFTLYPSSPSAAPYAVLSHRNPIRSSLIDLLRRHVLPHSKPSKQRNPCPDWATSLVHPHPDDPEGFQLPHCYVPAQMHLSRAPCYHRLCPSQTLQQSLQGTHFTEFPSIHVYDPDSSAFVGNVLTKDGQLLAADVRTVAKRRKLNAKAGRKAISGLLGDYGGDSDSPSECALASHRRDELRALGDYSGIEDTFSDAAPDHDAEAVDWGDDWDEE